MKRFKGALRASGGSMSIVRYAAALAAVLLFGSQSIVAQGRGRGGIPNATAEQTAAVAQLNAALASPIEQLAQARAEAVNASLAQPKNDAAIRAKVDAVRAAEFALANARAEGLAKLQASANALSSAQLSALAASANAPARGGGNGSTTRTTMPHVTIRQANALLEITAGFTAQSQALAAARAELTAAALTIPRNDATIRAKADAAAAAELVLANTRASGIAKLQSTADRLDAEQLAWLAASGGSYGQGGFTEPEPMSFNDHRGYVPLFDGTSLKGWDGNPKFWRVENGAIVGESTPQNPSGNTYIAYRDVVAKDFTLKFEMKIEGDGGSGLQYRSKTGIPWSRPIPANVTANVGPVNLNWMMTGPQADFWPSRIYTGQFYSENTPMGIMAYRGEVVEGAGLGARRLMGTIGDRTALGSLVKANDWNEYTVIARGGTFIHIVNGQLMAVMVDDDPDSSNNQPGIFGIEIEATTKVSVRNIWLKKLN
jgi:hypothetical protein